MCEDSIRIVRLMKNSRCYGNKTLRGVHSWPHDIRQVGLKHAPKSWRSGRVLLQKAPLTASTIRKHALRRDVVRALLHMSGGRYDVSISMKTTRPRFLERTKLAVVRMRGLPHFGTNIVPNSTRRGNHVTDKWLRVTWGVKLDGQIYRKLNLSPATEVSE